MPAYHSFNEAQTRYGLVDPQLTKRGWNLSDRRSVSLEVPVDGYDAVPIRKSKLKDVKKSSQLIKEVIEKFVPYFVPGAELVYVNDVRTEQSCFNNEKLLEAGVVADNCNQLPDMLLYWSEKNWLVLIESVLSHGAIDTERYNVLSKTFNTATAKPVFVTAVPSREVMKKLETEIAWETEIWVADAPTHMIHFNGERFLGPY